MEYSLQKDAPKAKILTVYHRRGPVLESDVIVPIHCGRAIAGEKAYDGEISQKDQQWLFEAMIGDDTGDNISHLNRWLNEMTALYWAWKNYDKLGSPDYIGLMTYRRHLSFRGGFAFDDQLSMAEYIQALDLSNERIHDCLTQHDAVVAAYFRPIGNPPHKMADHEFLVEVAKLLENRKSPLYKHWVHCFDVEKKGYFRNLFILKRERFFEFAELAFDVLLSLVTHPSYSRWPPRTAAYMGEYLVSLFFVYIKRELKLNVFEVPRVDRTWIWDEFFRWGQAKNRC